MKRENYYTTQELAKLLGISRVAVFKKIKSGEIKTVSAGRNYLISRDSLPEGIKKLIEQKQKETTEEIIDLSKKPEKDLDFEKELWKAADRLRGNIDPSEYKYIVLGLIFLKYVSDSFYQRKEELEKLISGPK